MNEDFSAMSTLEEAARRLLDGVSESLPDGNQVYRVRINGRAAYVTVPED
jgi:hypothetical protein